jgi:hypothetical protein
MTAVRLSVDVYEITVSEHPRFTLPYLDYRGAPAGIDVRGVVKRQITPVFNAGIGHRHLRVGHITAGFVRTPMMCFDTAARELGSL